jgi:hypothetical protein
MGKRCLVERGQLADCGLAVYLVALLLTVGCGSSLVGGTGGSGGATGTGGGAAGSSGAAGGGIGGGIDAAAQGPPYACAGGFIVAADGGEMAVADAGTLETCVVGQTYCAVYLPHPGLTGEATAGCNPAPAVCAQDPTCACFCDPSRGGLICSAECRCTETNGFVTISCEGI